MSIQQIKNSLPLYHKSFPLVLLWSAKCGCTSLMKWFFYQIELLEEANKYPTIHAFRTAYQNQQVDELVINLKQKPVVKLIRDPYSRAVSSFFEVLNTPVLCKQLIGDPNPSLSFKQFLQKLSTMNLHRNNANIHYALQHIEGEENYVSHYLNLEHFNRQIRKLEHKYQLKQSPLRQLTLSPHHRKAKMKQRLDAADVSFSRAMLKMPLPTYDSFYTTETLQLIRKIYEKDFDMYNFAK